MIRVLYFARARELAGVADEALPLPPGGTLGELWRVVAERHPALAALGEAMRLAVNEEFATAETRLRDGDVVAVIPPVSGGAGVCRVSDEPLSLDEVVRAVSADAQGGLVTFTGVVRDHSRGKRILRLEYEAYRPMAERKMAEIARAIEAELPGVRVAMVHRVGVLAVGEAAVVIAASAAHRAQAFEACRAAIDRLKESVPIWKKEFAEDGETWIGLGP